MRTLRVLVACLVLAASAPSALAAPPAWTLAATACQATDAIVFAASWDRRLHPWDLWVTVGESLDGPWSSYDPSAARPSGRSTTITVPDSWVADQGYPYAWVSAAYHGFRVTSSLRFTISELPECG